MIHYETMLQLVSAYQNNDIIKFEKILKTNHSHIMDNSFIREHTEELLQNIRTPVLINLTQEAFISKEASISVANMESLLVQCIWTSCSWLN